MKSALRYLFKSEAARHITTLFALALAAYSLFLFNRGYYWDDCGFVGNTVSVNTRYSNGTLYFPCLSLFKWIRYSDAYPIILKRGLTIISFFAMGTFIYLIAKRNCSLKRYAFWIAAITEVVPIYPHIYTNGNCGYIHCLAMLYFAFWLQTLHSKGCVHGWKRVAVILLSMLYYVKSFEMSSMFVFYALPFIYCFYLYAKSKTEIFNWRNTPRLFLSYCIRNTEFLLLPFIFWVIRIKWFPCTGGYATGYNQISINAIMDSPRLFLRTCHNLLYGYLKFYGMPSKLRTILPLLLFAIYTFIVWRHFEGVQKWLSMAIAAVAVMFLATFAYISVGDIANFDDVWETRWFAPVGLPVSLAIISITGFFAQNAGKSTKEGLMQFAL